MINERNDSNNYLVPLFLTSRQTFEEYNEELARKKSEQWEMERNS
ncbi:MAG: hypothetical protein ACXAEU_05165 [Candidatus Hodarchaeales archaeon]|jgi:hypothetical protein